MSEWIPILVIEDEEVVRMALERSLKLYGFQVYLAKNGQTGLQLAKEKQPALILLDWMMPEMDGLEVLAELKHDAETENIPVFMLTSRGMIGDLDQAFEIGADDYIRKPQELKKLGKIVKDKWEKYTKNSASIR
jgi:DNA-binding response OmpR family regulator